MSEYEQALVDRLAAKALIRGLPDRQRRIVCRAHLYGETHREIGAREGMSGARVGQILQAAERGLRHRANPPPPPEPMPQRRFSVSVPQRFRIPAKPPPDFDPAAFLKHMRALVARREAKEREVFAYERQVLDRMLESEEEPKAPPKPPPPPPKPKVPPYVPQWSGLPHAAHDANRSQAVEPWFDVSKPASWADLRQIAEYALRYFIAARRPQQYGLRHIGAKSATLQCKRTADDIAGALKRFADATGPAVFSAIEPESLHPKSAVFISCDAVALALTYHGDLVSLTFTWDVP